jgi:hypothetical protein
MVHAYELFDALSFGIKERSAGNRRCKVDVTNVEYGFIPSIQFVMNQLLNYIIYRIVESGPITRECIYSFALENNTINVRH